MLWEGGNSVSEHPGSSFDQYEYLRCLSAYDILVFKLWSVSAYIRYTVGDGGDWSSSYGSYRLGYLGGFMKIRFRAFAGVVSIVLLVSMTGCSEAPVSEADVVYVEPAWMAEQRLDVEEFQDEMVRCMEPFGIETERTMTGAVGLSARTDPESPTIDPAVEAAVDAAFAACYKGQIPEPKHLYEPADAVAYQKVLDVGACLRNEGYQLSEPPSESVWLQDVTAGKYKQWTPYNELYETGQLDSLTQPQLLELASKCPQTAHAAMHLSID